MSTFSSSSSSMISNFITGFNKNFPKRSFFSCFFSSLCLIWVSFFFLFSFIFLPESFDTPTSYLVQTQNSGPRKISIVFTFESNQLSSIIESLSTFSRYTLSSTPRNKYFDYFKKKTNNDESESNFDTDIINDPDSSLDSKLMDINSHLEIIVVLSPPFTVFDPFLISMIETALCPSTRTRPTNFEDMTPHFSTHYKVNHPIHEYTLRVLDSFGSSYENGEVKSSFKSNRKPSSSSSTQSSPLGDILKPTPDLYSKKLTWSSYAKLATETAKGEILCFINENIRFNSYSWLHHLLINYFDQKYSAQINYEKEMRESTSPLFVSLSLSDYILKMESKNQNNNQEIENKKKQNEEEEGEEEESIFKGKRDEEEQEREENYGLFGPKIIYSSNKEYYSCGVGFSFTPSSLIDVTIPPIESIDVPFPFHLMQGYRSPYCNNRINERERDFSLFSKLNQNSLGSESESENENENENENESESENLKNNEKEYKKRHSERKKKRDIERIIERIQHIETQNQECPNNFLSLSRFCFLISKEELQSVGGFDNLNFISNFQSTKEGLEMSDLSLRLLYRKKKLSKVIKESIVFIDIDPNQNDNTFKPFCNFVDFDKLNIDNYPKIDNNNNNNPEIKSPSSSSSSSSSTKKKNEKYVYPLFESYLPTVENFLSFWQVRLSTRLRIRQLSDLHIIWDPATTECTGFGLEALNIVTSLERYVNVGILQDGKICSGLPSHMRQSIERIRLRSFVHNPHLRSEQILLWVSHKHPDSYPEWPYNHVISQAWRPHVVVGRSMSESTRISSEWVNFVERVDQVWVPSSFLIDSFSNSGVPLSKLYKTPIPININSFNSRTTDPFIYNTIPKDHYIFLSIFKFEPRKGWEFLLEAYFSEFKKNEKVGLVIVTYLFNDDSPHDYQKIHKKMEAWARDSLGKDWDDLPKVHLISDELESSEIPRLYKGADAFVLPSRGEGWGMPHMEAMSMGLPTISTKWSGNLEFMNEDNSLLIDVEQMEPTSRQGFDQWAKPSVSHLRKLMRYVFENREEGAKIGHKAEEYIRKEFNSDTTAKKILNRVKEIEQHIKL